jgi:hypothetical protein
MAWLEGSAQVPGRRPRQPEAVHCHGPRRAALCQIGAGPRRERPGGGQWARPGWDPRGWSLADAARILLLVELSRRDDNFAAVFRDLCRTADVAEAVAFYRGLPLYARPGELEAQAAEGARSNMQACSRRGPPQPLSARAVRRAALEPHDPQGPVHRQRAGAHPGPRRAQQPAPRRHAARLRPRALGRRPRRLARTVALRRPVRRCRRPSPT